MGPAGCSLQSLGSCATPKTRATCSPPLAGLGSVEEAAGRPAAERSRGIARFPPHTGRVSRRCPKQWWVSNRGDPDSGQLQLGQRGFAEKQWPESSAGLQSPLCTALHPLISFPRVERCETQQGSIGACPCGWHGGMTCSCLPWPPKSEMGIREASCNQPQQLTPLWVCSSSRRALGTSNPLKEGN